LKTIVRASKNEVARCRTGQTAWGGDIEVYEGNRFFTITADVPEGWLRPIRDAQPELDRLLADTFGTTGVETSTRVDERPSPLTGHGDAEILGRMFAAKNGQKAMRLYNGDTKGYSSESEADLALCALIAFHVENDAATVDRIYRGSRLYRE